MIKNQKRLTQYSVTGIISFDLLSVSFAEQFCSPVKEPESFNINYSHGWYTLLNYEVAQEVYEHRLLQYSQVS